MDLLSKKCIPCEGSVVPLSKEQIAEYIKQISEWQLIEDKNIFRIKKRFKFANFKDALAFVNKVAALAEKEGHHPEMHISWGKVRLSFQTTAIRGLSENDFIMAAKIDNLNLSK